MQNYAIAEIAGYQYRIEEGAKLTVPHLETAVGDSITLDKLLLVNKDGAVTVGTPYIESAKAQAKVLTHNRSKKVLVFRKKRRKGFRRSATARKHQTVIQIAEMTI